MLGIIRKNDDTFQVNANDTSTEDLTLDELFKVMVSLEAEFDEIELAVLELIKNNHEYADFGVNRRFIFTREKL
jgi:hypothetical protein